MALRPGRLIETDLFTSVPPKYGLYIVMFHTLSFRLIDYWY